MNDLKGVLVGMGLAIGIMLIVWLTKQSLDNEVNHPVSHLPSGVYKTYTTIGGDEYQCRSHSLYTCGLHLYDCNNGSEHWCVADVEIELKREKRK